MSRPYSVPGRRVFKSHSIETTTMNFQLFKIDIDTIPIFEGKETQINAFIKTIDSIIERYSNHDEISATLRAAIFTKFRGKAAEILCPRDDLIKWADIRNAILQHFSDSRSIEQLLIEFNNVKLERNEDVINFGNRIRCCLSKLISKLNLSDVSNKILRQELYTANALDRFLVSIPYHISCQVRLRQPQTLDQAITFATDEINFLARCNVNLQYDKQLQKLPHIPIQNTKPLLHNSNQTPLTMPNHRPQFHPTFQQPQFPTTSISPQFSAKSISLQFPTAPISPQLSANVSSPIFIYFQTKPRIR